MEAPNAIPSQRSYYPERIFPERIPRMSMSKPMQGVEIPKGTVRVRSDLVPFIRPFEEKERRKQELQRRLDLRRRQPLFMACPSGQSFRYVSRVARNNNHDRQQNRQLPYCTSSIQQRGAVKQRSYLKVTHRDVSGQWSGTPDPQYIYQNAIQSYGPFDQQLSNPNSSQCHYQWQEPSNHQAYLEKWNESIQQQASYTGNVQWLGSVQQGQFIGQQPAYFNTTHGFTDQKFTYPSNTQMYRSVEHDIRTTTHPLSYSNNTQEYGSAEQEQEQQQQQQEQQQSAEPQPSNLDNTSEPESIGHWYATLVKWCDSPKEWQEPLEQEYSGPESIHIIDKESDVNTSYDNSSSV